MYSTPTHSYYDNPLSHTAYLLTLNEGDSKMYTIGYVQACHHFLESLIETKNRFLTKALEYEDTHPEHKRLLGHVDLLDMLDSAIAERVDLIGIYKTD